MATTGTATRLAKTGHTFYYLENPVDIIPLMEYLLTLSFAATLRAYNVEAAANWDLVIEDERPGADQLAQSDRVKTMYLGDVAVYDPVTEKLTTMRIETFQTDYDEE